MEIRHITALEIGRLISERQISCADAAASVLGAVSEAGGKLNAYISLQREKAFYTAIEIQSRLDKGEVISPFAGVPVSVSDNICANNAPATCGSRMLDGFSPAYNATVIDKLQAAGAIIAGRLNMDEFGIGDSTETSFFGATRNPWDTESIPGGSAGGAAVAGGEAVCAVVSDTGGSILKQSSFCGVSGIKPTYGTVSRYGLIACSPSFDQIGVLGRDIRDCAAILQIISGHDAKDSTSLTRGSLDCGSLLSGNIGMHSLDDVRIGLPRNYLPEINDPDVRRGILDAVKTFEDLGARVEEFTTPYTEYAVPAYTAISSAEISSGLSRYCGINFGYRADSDDLNDLYFRTRGEGFGYQAKLSIMLGSFVLSSDNYNSLYHKALQARAIIRDSFQQVFDSYDMILSPITPCASYKTSKNINAPLCMSESSIFTAAASLAGLPLVAAPCGFGRGGMPFGMQLIGNAFSELKLIRAADAFQQATDYHRRRCI